MCCGLVSIKSRASSPSLRLVRNRSVFCSESQCSVDFLVVELCISCLKTKSLVATWHFLNHSKYQILNPEFLIDCNTEGFAYMESLIS